jgi:hypothetical protein
VTRALALRSQAESALPSLPALSCTLKQGPNLDQANIPNGASQGLFGLQIGLSMEELGARSETCGPEMTIMAGALRVA